MTRLLTAIVVVLIFICTGVCHLNAADGAWFSDEHAREKGDFIWRTDDPAHRPSFAPAIWHTLVWQGIGFGVLQSMSQHVTNLEDPSFDNLREAFKRGPARDYDHWQWNYIAHPLWGSETYLRARGQGFGRFPSFLFSTASSVVWEFCFEGWSTRPSTDDLLLTSTVGSLLGELRFHVKRRLARNESKTARVLDFLVDPLHGASRTVGGWFGRDWREPAYERVDARLPGTSSIELDPAMIDGKFGVTVRVAWRF